MVPARFAGIGHGAKDGHCRKDTQRRNKLIFVNTDDRN